MFFSKSNSIIKEPDVYMSGMRLQVVPQYKYLGILIDPKLTFKAQVKFVSSRVGPIDDAIVHRRWLTDIMMLSRHRDSRSHGLYNTERQYFPHILQD